MIPYDAIIEEQDDVCTHYSIAFDSRITARAYEDTSTPMEVIMHVKEVQSDPIVLHIVTGEPLNKFWQLANLLPMSSRRQPSELSDADRDGGTSEEAGR